MGVSDEATWVARARAGDQAAFAELYGRYERRIYVFTYRMLGNPDDAFDLTQETFLKAYRAIGRTDEALNVNAWIHRIASNACLDALRRRHRIRWLPWEGTLHQHPDVQPAGDAERQALGEETRRTVQRALDQMAPRRRQALILREYEGLSYGDIGEVLDLSLPAVKSLLYRAREEFRVCYQHLDPAEEVHARRQRGRASDP
jgi:RNA polymerase sigma-70 factor (ECF subfamily)